MMGNPKLKSFPLASGGGFSVNPTAAEVFIYGDIGQWWDDESVSALQFIEQIQNITDDVITVRISSFGGSVIDGLAIYNALKRHTAKIIVEVDSIAASIASSIAMAGDDVGIASNAMFMIHAPMSGTYGNAKELREAADNLERFADAMRSSYSEKTQQPDSVIDGWLSGDKDHYFSAEEAMAFGLADRIGEELQIAAHAKFKQDRFNNIPAAAAAFVSTTKEPKMAKKQEPAAVVAPEVTPAPAAEPVVAAADPAAVQAALAQDQNRRNDITAAAQPFAHLDGVSDVVTACCNDHSCTVAQANAKVMAQLGTNVQAINPTAAVIVEDERDKFREAAGNAILARARVPNAKVDMSGNQFRGATLMDIVRASLDIEGRQSNGMDKRELVAAAFMHSSDFPVLLQDTMHKVVIGAFNAQAVSWREWCKVGQLADFREHKRITPGIIGALDDVIGGQVKNKDLPDGEQQGIKAKTVGNLINLTREMMINDDLSAFSDLAMAIGASYSRTIDQAAYALLASNPTMADGVALFHADHKNLISSGSGAPSMAQFELMDTQLGKQVAPGKASELLELQFSNLLVPRGMRSAAKSVNEDQYNPDGGKVQQSNTARGMFNNIIASGRLTGDAYYGFADPQEAPVIEVGFIDGVEEPMLEEAKPIDRDGMQLRVLGDFGVAAIGYRGVVKNSG